MGTLFVGLIVLAIAAAAAHSIWKDKKSGAAAVAVETVEVVPGARRKTDSSCQRER